MSAELHKQFTPYVAKKNEEYMNTRQLAHFRKILEDWKGELSQDIDRTVHTMQDEATIFADPNDRATIEEENSIELRIRDRERKMLPRVDAALRRIDEGRFGFCEETGDPIGLRRLLARPTTVYSIEAQERHERRERVYRDD